MLTSKESWIDNLIGQPLLKDWATLMLITACRSCWSVVQADEDSTLRPNCNRRLCSAAQSSLIRGELIRQETIAQCCWLLQYNYQMRKTTMRGKRLLPTMYRSKLSFLLLVFFSFRFTRWLNLNDEQLWQDKKGYISKLNPFCFK